MMENNDKRSNLLIYIIFSMAVLIVAVWLSYFVFYKPSASQAASYIEVFQEVEHNSISTLNVECVDHKVVIRPSSDDKIRIRYYQKQDNSITYTANASSVLLKMVERSEDLDNLFYQSKRKIDTITIYVPVSMDLTIRVNSVDGSLDASDIEIRSLSFTSVNGPCLVSYVKANKLGIVSNYGDINVSSCDAEDINISQVTGKTAVKLDGAINDYGIDAASNYGTLLVNGQKLYQNPDDTSIVVNYLRNDGPSSRKVTISGIRNSIEISSVEEPVAETEQ